MNIIPFSKRRKSEIEEIVLDRKGPVIYVDFVLVSMVKSVEDWYDNYYQTDPWKILQKAHTYHIIRFYDYKRFSNHETIGKERSDYLTEVDLYVQMKRED